MIMVEWPELGIIIFKFLLLCVEAILDLNLSFYESDGVVMGYLVEDQ